MHKLPNKINIFRYFNSKNKKIHFLKNIKLVFNILVFFISFIKIF